MTTQEYIKTQAYFCKWIDGLTENELQHLNDMLEEYVALRQPPVSGSLLYEKVIKYRADYFRKIMHKYEAQRLEECLRTIKELIPPENWNEGNEA